MMPYHRFSHPPACKVAQTYLHMNASIILLDFCLIKDFNVYLLLVYEYFYTASC